jgi:hypothetical protein
MWLHVANGTAPEGKWLTSAMTDPGGYDEAPPAATGQPRRVSSGLLVEEGEGLTGFKNRRVLPKPII